MSDPLAFYAAAAPGLVERFEAVEPVAELRAAGMARHGGEKLAWLDDRLPDLAALRCHPPFGLITLCAVWQHLDEEARRTAMANIAGMIAEGGLLILSLRHGPGAPDRPVLPVRPEETIADADRAGLALLRRVEADSVQPGNRAVGVRWTWLAFGKEVSDIGRRSACGKTRG
ncbi:MAG: SAM-dependent methyltransferase [Alphaproteobacteria bacterium]|nr:SAM-dependent methyltransferase [Alphaproteobacteria bacterium]